VRDADALDPDDEDSRESEKGPFHTVAELPETRGGWELERPFASDHKVFLTSISRFRVPSNDAVKCVAEVDKRTRARLSFSYLKRSNKATKGIGTAIDIASHVEY